MHPTRDDLDRLRRLRELFLDESRGTRALADYWRNERDLRAYDRVFAARIGWKWDAALAECDERGWRRDPQAVVLDFGCGTGIAARRYAAHFGAAEVLLHDRSPAAMRVAAAALAAEHPDCRPRAVTDVEHLEPDVLLVSHVLAELDEAGLQQLRELLRRSRSAVLVEPGNRAASRRLGTLRDELVGTFAVVAPCAHANACPALPRDEDWCHFFASPPAEVFTTGHWAVAARELGIDLRALPYAFLAIDRQAHREAPAHRVVGRAHVHKHDASLQVCSSTGLATTRITKRATPELFRRLRKQPQSLRQVPDTPQEDR